MHEQHVEIRRLVRRAEPAGARVAVKARRRRAPRLAQRRRRDVPGRLRLDDRREVHHAEGRLQVVVEAQRGDGAGGRARQAVPRGGHRRRRASRRLLQRLLRLLRNRVAPRAERVEQRAAAARGFELGRQPEAALVCAFDPQEPGEGHVQRHALAPGRDARVDVPRERRRQRLGGGATARGGGDAERAPLTRRVATRDDDVRFQDVVQRQRVFLRDAPRDVRVSLGIGDTRAPRARVFVPARRVRLVRGVPRRAVGAHQQHHARTGEPRRAVDARERPLLAPPALGTGGPVRRVRPRALRAGNLAHLQQHAQHGRAGRVYDVKAADGFRRDGFRRVLLPRRLVVVAVQRERPQPERRAPEHRLRVVLLGQQRHDLVPEPLDGSRLRGVRLVSETRARVGGMRRARRRISPRLFPFRRRIRFRNQRGVHQHAPRGDVEVLLAPRRRDRRVVFGRHRSL